MEKEKQVERFGEHLRDTEHSENTIYTYIVAVKKYFEMFDDVTKKNMIAFKTAMVEGYAPKTAHNRCVAMNSFCDFAGKPECKVKSIKIHKKTTIENVITKEEYQQLLQSLLDDKNEKMYWMIQYLAKTGARVSEFIRFEKKHLEAGKVELWTKGKIREILIPRELIESSREYFERQPENKWMFPNRYGGQMSTRGVAEMIKRKGIMYGIREEVLHPHSFRHLYAIQFLKNNGNIALLADLMGHESVDTTSIYLRLSESEQREQFNKAMNW